MLISLSLRVILGFLSTIIPCAALLAIFFALTDSKHFQSLASRNIGKSGETALTVEQASRGSADLMVIESCPERGLNPSGET